MAVRKSDPVARFWAQVKASATSDCWIWTGSRSQLGYGQFWNGTKGVRAHRWSYEYMVDDIAPGWHIDHLCSVPECVNPQHLEVVSAHVNMKRSVARGRWRGIYNHPDDVPPTAAPTHRTAHYVQAVEQIKDLVASGTISPPVTPKQLDRMFRLQTKGRRAALSWLAAAGIADREWLIPPQPKQAPSPVEHEANKRFNEKGRFLEDPGVHIALPTGHLLWATTEEYAAKPREELDQEIADLAAARGVFVKEKT